MSKNNVPSSNDGVKPKGKKPKTFPRTDSGNAELFSQHYQEKLRYDHKHERWLTWREHWWAEDAVESVVRMAKNAARLRSRILQVTPMRKHERRRLNGQKAASQAPRSPLF